MSTNHASEYVEIGPRLYSVAIVPSPLVVEGRLTTCHIDHDAQRVNISEAVPARDRQRVQERAVIETLRRLLPSWRLVPLVGQVS